MPKLSVKKWAEEDRPREKMLLKGIHSLSDAELLAIIIGSGNKEETAVELSQRILLSTGNSLNRLGKVPVKKLISDFKGVGEAKAISLCAAMELGKRRKSEDVFKQEKFTSSHDIYEYFYSLMSDLPHEEFWIVFLNRSNRVIDRLKISQGGVSETVVDTKLILKEAIIRLASSVVLCHNHPSGNTDPSWQDDGITRKIKECCLMFDISVIDHLIICDNKYYSYADNGRIL
ncbi:MAG: DNA repair protein RadC [Dysgonamonadaceae bacterium]|jgi:DNA repair protein RadC|nr:DNA repair protein RadC [Dysgonamonadaceae bacterium]